MPATSLRLLLLGILASALLLPLRAQDVIRAYHSTITVHRNATLTVQEAIRVQVSGTGEIRHGIYRDFPTRYRDRFGNRVRITFTLLSTRLDDRATPSRVEQLANGLRIYLGDPQRLVTPGEHLYEIAYRVNRELGFFADFDELYWNVTGNGWVFPIERAAATVILPEVLPRDKIKTEAYTGRFGAKATSYDTWMDDGTGQVHFATKQPLGAHENLTIVVAFPKGLVTPPTFSEKLGYFFADNLVNLFLILLLIVVLGYFLLVWWHYGRDLPSGTIIPLYTPPASYSPAALRYVRRMGFDNKVLTAAIIDLAVKGHVTVTEVGGGFLSRRTYQLKRTAPAVTEGTEAALPEEEGSLLNVLLPGVGDVIALDNREYRVFQNAQASTLRALRAGYENRFFVTNLAYYVPGVLLSGIPLLIIVISTNKNGFSLVQAIAAAIFIAIDILFFKLMKAPTVSGRKLLDDIDGFRMYLETAEKDELNLQNPPERTPELFERYLPYALALDVEQQWSEKFAGVLARAMQDGHPYHPAWYYGSAWSAFNVGSFSSSLGSSLSQAISSSSTAPGSSSGSGGGGSSGGGGGGGGGGGW